MSAGKGECVMGYAIRATSRRISADDLASDPASDPASVGIQRLGGDAPTYFTPREARAFADAILRAACAAEVQGGAWVVEAGTDEARERPAFGGEF